MRTHEERLAAARVSLEGLSVGDGVGRQFDLDDAAPPWRYSDDTEMAIAIVDILARHRTIEQDGLAAEFAKRFAADPERGYGPVAYWLLSQLTTGRDWRSVSKEPYRGQGSLGNGAAMRVAPIGAYFADDFAETARQAALSAAITHAHPDGQAGAIAVAIAAAYCETRDAGHPAHTTGFFEAVLAYTPEGATRAGIVQATSLPTDDAAGAAAVLGDGTQMSSAQTVPLSIWCAAHHLDSYEAALLTARAACHRPSADRDTVCAIVGSIVVLSSGLDAIPAQWRSACEPLPSAHGRIETGKAH